MKSPMLRLMFLQASACLWAASSIFSLLCSSQLAALAACSLICRLTRVFSIFRTLDPAPIIASIPLICSALFRYTTVFPFRSYAQ